MDHNRHPCVSPFFLFIHRLIRCRRTPRFKQSWKWLRTKRYPRPLGSCLSSLSTTYTNTPAHTANDTPWGVEIVPEADVVGLRVFDGGVGIAREELPRMFVERVPPLHFRGKGLLALQKHAMTGAVKDAKVSSRGTTVRFQGSHSTVTGMRASAPGVEITALCRRSGFQ